MEVVFEIQRNSRTSRLSFYSTRLWKQESYNDENRSENDRTIYYVGEKGRHFDPRTIRNTLHHEIRAVTYICVGPHEYSR